MAEDYGLHFEILKNSRVTGFVDLVKHPEL
jgi:hypothetical protein